MLRAQTRYAAFGLAGMLASGCGGGVGTKPPQAPVEPDSSASSPAAAGFAEEPQAALGREEAPEAERAVRHRPRAGRAPSAPSPSPEDRKAIGLLDRVYFGENDDALPRELEALDAYAAAAGADAGVTLILIAHADAAEREPEGLSRRRAESVRSYLVGRGVPAERIRVRAMGAREPIQAGDVAGAAENRCVELAVEPGK